MRACVYAIYNVVDDKAYVGSTRDWATREKNHRSRLQKGRHDNRSLQAAWSLLGEDAFIFVVLETCNPQAMRSLERTWIERFKRKVYNVQWPVVASCNEVPLTRRKRGQKWKKGYVSPLERKIREFERIQQLSRQL